MGSGYNAERVLGPNTGSNPQREWHPSGHTIYPGISGGLIALTIDGAQPDTVALLVALGPRRSAVTTGGPARIHPQCQLISERGSFPLFCIRARRREESLLLRSSNSSN